MILKKILSFASSIPEVKVVVMNGSRVNPNVSEDEFQDYDLIFFIENPEKHDFRSDLSWIKLFGTPVITQQNDFDNGSYIVMTQYETGLRIDLNFYNLNMLEKTIKSDSLTKILLDKNGLVKESPVPNESSYYIKKPTQQEFANLMNEFWWIQPYITKGILRGEIPYAKYMYDTILMECIKTVLNWSIGSNENWKVNTGKCGKWLKKYLDEQDYKTFISLYPSADPQDIIEKLEKAQEFIYEKAGIFSIKANMKYNAKEAFKVMKFTRKQFAQMK